MFTKLLIANRGEIAVRVARTARRLGIRTVAVYSDADAGAQHVKVCDEAVHIGPAPAAESYLVMDKIIAAATRTGAQAIHPGYGFLSENARFAEACAEAGITFVGPPPAAIRAMGEKAAAKAAMVKAGVPVVPGYHGAAQDDDLLAAEAEKIGWPVLIKAVAGGGGKGMRQVHGPDKFAAELRSARREAKAAFGDDKVLIEKYLVKPRHIEVQVFADSHGNVVHLFERDCSVQRRHQKVLEEAPAPGMSAGMRRAMGEAAVQAAKAIGYVGAGTIEFIADVSHGLRDDAFYFMEMNTRLQVEHPVTELITGQDLVEWQLRVAAGEKLPTLQDELAIDGHAVEARVYAEDPGKRFLPSTGRLLHLRPPAEDAHIRVDSGVVEGDTVSIFYDPMIAKLIAWDVDRPRALRRLRQALGDYRIAGVATNVTFLAAVAGHPAFVAGDLDTGFIDRHRDDLIPQRGPAPDQALALACLHLVLMRREAEQARAAAGSEPRSPWALLEGFRVNDDGHDDFVFVADDAEVVVTVRYTAGGYVLSLLSGEVPARVERVGDGLEADIGGLRKRAHVIEQGDQMTVLADGHAWRLTRRDPMAFAAFDLEESGSVNAPLPGKIVQLIAKPGQAVKKGDPLLVMEAMKMEHTIAAPADGTIARLNYAEGEQVDEGAELVSFEE
jgi:3-methylcrotonyl-CoA carboxylase alpha subunit